MEKISIVQRRKNLRNEIQTAALTRARQRKETHKAVYNYADSMQEYTPVISLNNSKTLSEAPHILDLELNAEQSYEINSVLNLNDSMKWDAKEANVQIYRNDNKRIIFHFSISPSRPFQTLTSEDVCEMLKISRKKLYRNVHENKIPCFKIGSQLRFLAEDIITYLKKNIIKNESVS